MLILNKIFLKLAYKGWVSWLPDKIYLKILYKILVGKKLDLRNPKTFNEKLQWLKLYDRKLEYIQMVDKYEAKNYVAKIIGKKYIIPTLGKWDKFEDIDFSKLPNQFVLKCTHDSGGLVICKDKSKFNINEAKRKINNSLKRNYFYSGREWPYKQVRPRIIAEEYIKEDGKEELTDYKLMSFNGKVRITFTCTNRYSQKGMNITFFNNDWEKLPFKRKYPSSNANINKPETFKTMIELAEKLSAGVPFLRVDFYEVNGKIYFGELTFYPGSGFEKFEPEEWDYNLGKWIKLEGGNK